jgi:hypothetical protein
MHHDSGQHNRANSEDAWLALLYFSVSLPNTWIINPMAIVKVPISFGLVDKSHLFGQARSS